MAWPVIWIEPRPLYVGSVTPTSCTGFSRYAVSSATFAKKAATSLLF
jgi:hypothetical protein